MDAYYLTMDAYYLTSSFVYQQVSIISKIMYCQHGSCDIADMYITDMFRSAVSSITELLSVLEYKADGIQECS